MQSTLRRLGLSELLPRYVFAQSLFAGRSLLEVGAVASTRGRSAHFLSTRGARAVLACDADAAAVERAQNAWGGPNLRYGVCAFDSWEKGSFDLALIADLADCVRRPEQVADLRRLVSAGGFLLGGFRNPGGLSFSQLVEPEPCEAQIDLRQVLDLLAPHFPQLQVATQSPVIGYQLAFEQGQGLRVDGTLGSAGEAAYFIIVAGEEICPVVQPTWVQLPPEPLAYVDDRAARAAEEARRLESECTRLTQKLEAVEAERDSLRRALPRARLQVQQIYERAAAELSAVRAELLRKPGPGPAPAGDAEPEKV